MIDAGTLTGTLTGSAPGRDPASWGQTATPGADRTQPPTHEAQALTHGGTRAQILLNGQTYSLRITRSGKLILTK